MLSLGSTEYINSSSRRVTSHEGFYVGENKIYKLLKNSKLANGNESLRSMVVDAINETGNVTTLIRTNYKALRGISSRKQSHHAVPIIVFTILHVIDVSNILRDYGQILYKPICLNSETV